MKDFCCVELELCHSQFVVLFLCICVSLFSVVLSLLALWNRREPTESCQLVGHLLDPSEDLTKSRVRIALWVDEGGEERVEKALAGVFRAVDFDGVDRGWSLQVVV